MALKLCFMESFHGCAWGWSHPHGAWKPCPPPGLRPGPCCLLLWDHPEGSVLGGLWSQTTLIQTPASPPTSCVMLGRSFNLSVPRFCHLGNLDSNSTLYLSYSVVVGLNKLKRLAHSKYYLRICYYDFIWGTLQDFTWRKVSTAL